LRDFAINQLSYVIFFIVSFNLYTAIPKSPPKQTMVYTMTGENGDMMPEGVPKKKAGGHH
jgi:hypothetical protein